MDFWIYLNETYPTLLEDSISVRIHESESHAVEYIIGHLNERTWVLVDFSNCRDADDFQYKIRMNYTTLPNTNLIVNTVAIGLSRRYQRYYLSGYLSIQRTVNEFALSRNNCEQADTNMWSMPMPTAAYSQNSFFQAVGFLLGLTIAMAYLYPTSRTIKSMVEEKETRMKETLYILGVRPWAHWLSWVLTTSIIFLLITILVTYTLASQVLLYSSPAYLLAFIGLFSTSTMGFCFVIASFFSRAKLAAIVGPMALFATLLPRFIFFGSNRYEAINAKKLASLLPCTAFAFGADIIADYEYAEVGVQSFNANMGDYSFNTSLSFLFLDTFLYMFLGWYLELVIPRQYGVARPFYFILLPSYWWSCVSCLVRRQPIGSGGERSVGIVSGERTADSKGYEVESEDVEPVTDPLLVARVSIHALVKRYSRKHDDPPAVNNLNLTMYESQITCLLGHNGAGKTSTISMLTGLFPPTTGDCVIYGNSIIHDTSNARQSMGICPQHNVLFDRLTVIEHLTFFQKIKGLKPTKDDVRDKALEVGLGEYFTTTSSALSGGNKRKLSLAIALCGDPRFLLLDEPTSGMDPASRRACWELLRQKRLGRVTLLTTHFLDEASLLADRIAVMKEGQLQCCGSELFLKNRFGLGYNLTIVMNANSREPCADESGEFDPTSELLDERNILAFFNGVVPGTELVRKSAREITFRFPQGLESLFPDAFDALEAAKDRLGIGAYGISNTTLEEVFLQLVEKDSMPQAESGDTNSDDHASSPSVTEKGTVDFGSDDELVRKGLAETPIVKQEDLIHISAFRQVILLYMKRFVIQRRDLKGGFFMIVLPVILCGLVLLVLTLDIVLAGPAIDMSLSLYKPGASDVVGLTDVLVGGGASMVQDSVSRSALSGLFSNLSTSLHAEYPNTNFSHKVDAISSSNLSQYLLDTYNDHDHNSRYGAFALRDIVPLQLNVDWDALSNDLNNSTFFGEGGTLDFGSLRFNITTKNVVDVILALSPFDVNATINSTMLHSITSQAIKDIINSAANSNSSLVSQNLQGAFSDFVNDIALIGDESVNATLIRAVDRFFDGIAFAVTDGVIEALNSTKYADYFEALKESDVAFDRQIIRDGWVDLFHGISVLDNGTDFELNSTTLVDDFLRFYDDIVNSFDNSTEKGPNALLLVPLIFVDGFLQEAIANNATSTRVEDVLLKFSDLLSGSKGDEGNLHLRAEAVLLEVSTLQITFVKATIDSGLGVLLENEDIVLPLNGRNFLPPGIQTYEFDFDSSASILHNSSSPHAVAAFNQAYAEFLYKQCSTNPKQARLLSVNHPLPLTTQQSIEIQTTLSVLASLFLLIPYCYIPAAFVVFLVKERVSKSKHLQLVSGVNMSSYWISTYLWDLSLFFLLSILVILVFLIYGQEAAVVFVGTTESLIATFALTFGYGLSALPFAYLLSRSFNNHSSAQIAIMGIFFITGFVAVNAYFILISIETTKDLAEALLPYFRSWPAYNVGEGFISLSNAYWEREILGSTNRPFDWDVTGRSLALIYGLSVPYFCILLMLEYSDDGGSGGLIGRVLRNIRGSYESISLRWHGVHKADDGVSLMLDDGLDEFNTGEDEDVAAERTHVIANSESLKTSASVLLVNMWKVYPPSVGVFGSFVASIRNWFSILCCHLTNSRQETEVEIDRSFLPKRAVRGITTSIPQGETYGLLGVNGAGVRFQSVFSAEDVISICVFSPLPLFLEKRKQPLWAS
jgi:ABC-type multidrug transport system ATPase subunit